MRNTTQQPSSRNIARHLFNGLLAVFMTAGSSGCAHLNWNNDLDGAHQRMLQDQYARRFDPSYYTPSGYDGIFLPNSLSDSRTRPLF